MTEDSLSRMAEGSGYIASTSLLDSINRTLPRVLALFDTDVSSTTVGFGDRLHWAWNIKDFANGTFQGAVNGLATLCEIEHLPEGMSKTRIVERIWSMIMACKTLQRKDGSFEETFPYEGSYCVTALVLSDVLAAVLSLKNELSDEQRLWVVDTFKPSVKFLLNNNESHGFISNHLATAALALVQWEILTGEDTGSASHNLVSQILSNQSKDGGYLEYQGHDPGYQSLCMHYLAGIHALRPSKTLLDSLLLAIEYLSYFAHPDGSFGGIYGARNTRFYYPTGPLFLANYSDSASALANFMASSIAKHRVVGLETMDESNLIPMFNAYCQSLKLALKLSQPKKQLVLPCQQSKSFRKVFEDSGLIIDRGMHHYTIVSLFKGGVVYHFRNNQPVQIDCGVLCKFMSNEQLHSTQHFQPDSFWQLDENTLQIRSELVPLTKQALSPFKLLLLRMANLTFMRSKTLSNIIKRILVYILITRKGQSRGQNLRVIEFGENFSVKDHLSLIPNMKQINHPGVFVAVHMASKGYWQFQDTCEKS